MLTCLSYTAIYRAQTTPILTHCILSKLWSRFFAGETCFERMELKLQALVPESGKVKFVRKGIEHLDLFWKCKTRQLNLLVYTLSGSQTIAVEADPRESVASVCSDFRTEYEIAAINGLTVFGEHLFDLCFEDLADDSLTLTLTAFKRPRGPGWGERESILVGRTA